MFPKERAARDRAYLDWVRGQPCVVTGMYGVEAHHVIGHGRCGTVKTSDYLAIPLTREMHRRLHDKGWRAWEAEHGSQLEHAARTLERAVAEGFFSRRAA